MPATRKPMRRSHIITVRCELADTDAILLARPASRARFLPQQARLGRSEDPARSASATTRCHT